MRQLILPVLLCLLTLTATRLRAQEPDNVQKAKTFEKQITRIVQTDYLLFLPKGYDEKEEKRWPLILFLHGSGERGTNVWLVAKHGPPKVVKDQPDFPFILVSPQCAEGALWENGPLLALLDNVIHRYNVDTSRVYLTGLSMGGYGTWSLGLTHPEKFAAIAPICGGGSMIDPLLKMREKNSPLKTLPVWAFHGAKDPVVPLAESERMVEALKKGGCKEVELTIYPEAKHDSWVEAYNNPKLYEWFLAHQRQ